MNTHLTNYFLNIINSSKKIDLKKINEIILSLRSLKKKKGRVFFLGVGGSAGNCSHAVNDFRKICNIECYAPTDNVSELTARINDDGWESSFVNWLKVSNLKKNDAIFVFSVGGGNLVKKVSVNLIQAIKFAKQKKTLILGIVGKKNSFLEKNGDVVLKIPIKNENLVTPISESFQAVIWHSIVSDSRLQLNKTKW
ncbi:SIS domain-containing protein [Candidatus Pelagibacter sp.]|uniref:SIS domain-containing protein n=1 Tax=Candidatus Pelagibacter sp. TaxID=2024849 RepID=UPI003D0FA925